MTFLLFLTFRMTGDNISVADEDLIIQTLNDEKLRVLIPVIVYITVLMVFGLAGNVMVFYYNWFKARTTTFSIFISLLSAYDLMTCVVGIPIEIIRIVYFYRFESELLCRLMRFSNYFASTGSILVLFFIAVDRYRRICKWNASQMSLRFAKISCFASVVTALIFTWPAIFVYGVQHVRIPNNYDLELNGSICTGIWDKTYKPYVSSFYYFMLGLVIIFSVVFIILYSKIGLQVHFHKRKLARYKRTNPTQPTMIELSRNSFDTCLDEDSMGENTLHRIEKTERFRDTNDNSRLILMFVSITVLFMISYVPVFVVIIWRQFLGKYHMLSLGRSGILAFSFATTSFLINSAANPWLYGILCSDFRQYIFNWRPR